MNKKLFLLALIGVLCMFMVANVIAIAESETEFFTYDKKEMAFTVLEINDDGTVDVMISEPVPINVKSLDEGESQQYYSNWECFVATLVEVHGSKSDVYLSKCYKEDSTDSETEEVVDDSVEIDDSVEVDDNVEEETNLNITTDYVDFDTEEAPPIEISPSESFFDKEVKMGNVLVAVLIMLIIIMIVMLSVIVYLKNNI